MTDTTIPVRELPALAPRYYSDLHRELAEYFTPSLEHHETVPTVEQLQKWQRDLDFIVAHNELHYQGTWAMLPMLAEHPATDAAKAVECGTTCCIAGWHVLLEGKTIERTPDCAFQVQESPDPDTWTERGLGRVAAYAIDDLGLFDFTWSPHPFDGDQSLDDLFAWELALRQAAVAAGVIDQSLIRSDSEEPAHA